MRPVIFISLKGFAGLCSGLFFCMKRLDEIYKLINRGKGVADIGTDHGEIPVRLALSDYPGTIFASDIHPLPLETARRKAAEAGVEDRIYFSCSDGLEECKADSVDTIIIAGLGADTICSVLDRAEWTMSDKISLILQPMTKGEVLRYWLTCNGYSIEKEQIVRENGSLFRVLCARFSDRNTFLTDAELFLGQKKLTENKSAYADYTQKELHKIHRKIKGMEESSVRNPEYRFFQNIYKEMETIYLECLQEGK